MDAVIADESLNDSTRRQLRSIRMELSELLVELREEILALRDPGASSVESWLRSRIQLDFSWRIVETNQNLSQSGVEVAHLLLELLNNAISHQGLESAEIVEDVESIRVHFCRAASGTDERSTGVGVRLGRVGISERLALLGVSLTESEGGFDLQWV